MAGASQSGMNFSSSSQWNGWTSVTQTNGNNCPESEKTEKNKSGMVRDGPSRGKVRLDSAASGFSYQDEFQQKLSRINGAINQMSCEQMQKRLKEFQLNTNGCKDVLKKRLKNYYKQQRLSQINKPPEEMKYDYFVVIDFEATCSQTNEDFIHEIIEFPAVLVDTRSKAVCNVFQRFCKPKLNPTLTDFCTELTGISQDKVDKAKDFKVVFREFEEWMNLHRLGMEKSFVVLTDGPWDMARFLKTQVDISRMEFPQWAKQWVNLRKAYTAFYGAGRINLQHMLDDLGMTFQGRPHCGLDDARNIAEISIRMLEDGCLMRVNEYLHEDTKEKAGTDNSPPRKSRLTQSKKARTNGKSSCCPPEIVQEGDDVADLLAYMKIQKS